MIHPTAIIHPSAQIDPTAIVEPCAVIDAHVALGANCRVGPHAYLTGWTRIGANNQFHAGCVIGDAPQDLKYRGQPTRLVIGDNNVFREHVTIHRSNSEQEETRIGSGGLFMAGCHVGHNSRIGDNVILANGALVGGHVEIGARAFISGHCLLHQFVRVGELALMQGGSGISLDLPPFTIARDNNRICGLNIIGLRRAGISAAQRLELKRVYRELFRRGLTLSEALQRVRGWELAAPAKSLVEFVAASKRGVCRDHATVAEEADDARE